MGSETEQGMLVPHRVVPNSTQHNICSGDEPGAGKNQQLMQGLCRGTVTLWMLTLPGPTPETWGAAPPVAVARAGEAPAAAAWATPSPCSQGSPGPAAPAAAQQWAELPWQL